MSGSLTSQLLSVFLCLALFLNQVAADIHALRQSSPRPHAVSSATLKGVAHTYQYDAAGYMTGDFVNGTLRRSFAWTSYGQLRRLDYTAAPALHRLSGGLAYGPADVRCDFLHDASGSRYLQRKLRTAPDASRVTEETLYLGTYERERHFTGTSSVPDRTVHRHSIGGFAVYTRTVESTGSVTRLSTILKDHLGSTDVIITGRWVATTFGEMRTERQSFDPWGERRDPATLALLRQSATDPFRTSSEDHDRGYTGHEQLDDSGLIHMNGRIYDPELGRMLSPDPFVQVPEYSQNFNRYSYVLNNPLNKTDPSGYSWLSEAFDKVGDWFSENWRTIVVWVAVVVLTFFGVGAALAGAITGALGAALNGGSSSDIWKSAAVGFAQGAVGGWAGNNTGTLGKAALTATAAGAANEALGGKFQDGFLSSLRYQAIMTSAELAGRMMRSNMTQENINGIGDVSTEEHEMLYKAGYDLHAQKTLNGTVDPSQLDLPPGWEFSNYYRNYEESYLDYAVFDNVSRGVRVMNYVGTQNDGGLFGDWLDNFAQGFGFRSKQYMKAIDFALVEQFASSAAGLKFVLNGHSLGGGLAAAGSAVTGAPAAIYNAAGINPITLRYAGFADRIPSLGQNVVHYGVGGEILTALEYSLFFAPRPTAANYYTWAPAAPQSLMDLSPIEWHRPAISMRSIP